MNTAHYEKVADEISHGDIDRGLWLEAFAASKGDEQAAKAQYIKLRIRKLHNLSYKAHREMAARSGGKVSATKGLRGVLSYIGYVFRTTVSDLWTAWLWMWTLTFAALTAVGLLCLGTMFYLKLFGDGALAWPCFTVGCAFVTFFLFGRGVQRLLARTPTRLFYGVEILALCAALWPVSHLMNPTLLGRIPPSLSSELVFLIVRFLHSGDPVANLLTAAIFLLPVYGVIAFLRQQKIQS